MNTFQVAALIAIALATAMYVWRGVRRALRAEARFFKALVEQLSRLLERKGFQLTRNVAQTSGLRIATFTSGTVRWREPTCQRAPVRIPTPRLPVLSWMPQSHWAALPNKRLKLTARVDYGMNLSSARRSLSAIR